MKSLLARLPVLTYALLAVYLLTMALRSHSETTMALVASSVFMFACCWASATHLFGPGPALRFVLIALVFGWFAEQMGSSRGWFFGQYTYTEVLGPRLLDVPLVIPLMWFALAYAGYVLASLIVWRSPIDGATALPDLLLLAFLAAMLVTAFDLGADPYLVYTLKAWIMTKKDGWWFGETLQGFVGWVTVAFIIIAGWRLSMRGRPIRPHEASADFTRRHALVPIGIYAGAMVFQMAVGNPVETRTIAFFAMGIPLLCALASCRMWVPVKAGADR